MKLRWKCLYLFKTNPQNISARLQFKLWWNTIHSGRCFVKIKVICSLIFLLVEGTNAQIKYSEPNQTTQTFVVYLISVPASLLQVAAGGRREEEAVPAPAGAAEVLAEPHSGGLRWQHRPGHPLSSSLSFSGAPGPAGLPPEEPPAPGGKSDRTGSVCSIFGII